MKGFRTYIFTTLAVALLLATAGSSQAAQTNADAEFKKEHLIYDDVDDTYFCDGSPLNCDFGET